MEVFLETGCNIQLLKKRREIDETHAAFLNNLDHFLNSHGIEVAEMAKKIGVPASTFYKVKSGEVEPKMRYLTAIAKELGVPVSELFRARGEFPSLDLAFDTVRRAAYKKSD